MFQCHRKHSFTLVHSSSQIKEGNSTQNRGIFKSLWRQKENKFYLHLFHSL